MPGLLVQLGIFGALFAGFGLVAEWRAGVIEAERVTPASRTALLLGRILRDVLQLLVQGIVLIALGFAFGLRASIGGMLYGLLLTLLLGASCAAASNALALVTKSEDVMAPLINSIALPMLLLSGILLPMTLAPQWLQTVSDFVPIKHIVDAIRAAFVGDFGDADPLGHDLERRDLRRAHVHRHPHVPQRERLAERVAWPHECHRRPGQREHGPGGAAAAAAAPRRDDVRLVVRHGARRQGAQPGGRGGTGRRRRRVPRRGRARRVRRRAARLPAG